MWYLIFMLIAGGKYDTVVTGPMGQADCERARQAIAITVPEGQDAVLACVPSAKEVSL